MIRQHETDSFRDRLIVSCQAAAGSPLDHPSIIAALARAAEIGGAGAVRINGVADIRAVVAAVSVPVIGLLKRRVDGERIFITPTLEDARAVHAAGADLVAVDATVRARPDRLDVRELIGRLREEGIRVVADIDDLESGVIAADAGADYLATTLAGYTSTRTPSGPDIELVKAMATLVSTPVIAEGRYQEPAQAQAAFSAGAYAVVVGSAITNPTALTRRFVAATPCAQSEDHTAHRNDDEA